MKLSQMKQHLDNVSQVNFVQLDKTSIPAHFHITELGLTTKHFIDCGGTVRTDKTATLQVWVENDQEHRLAPSKLKRIIEMSEHLFDKEDLEVEVEYQTDTVGKYGVDFIAGNFLFTPKHTDCLAKTTCGATDEDITPAQPNLQKLPSSCCAPNSGCC